MSAPSITSAWWGAARPATLALSIAPVMVGTGLAAANRSVHWGVVLAAALGAALIQIGTNLVNDWADFVRGADTHERLGPARATQRGWLTPRAILTGAGLAFAGATAAGVYLVSVGGWVVVAIGVASIASGVLYTAGPKPLAYVGLGDVFVFVFFGLVAVGATAWLQTGTVSMGAWLAGTGLGALSTAVLVVNNLRDRKTDERAGKRTLAVRFGDTAARVQYSIALVLAYAAVAAGALMISPGWWLAFVSAPLAAVELRGVWQRDGAELNRHLGGTARTALVYAVLLTAGMSL